ncbi:hypothetical protein HA052_24685 [Chromobacterium haemolyticum]|uniref:Transcriptional regulator n=1 Tax=Chromobacterium fluminis TaxID=3044269 RepID=A0ABX0LBE5_9NEIS|nr:MULTISPECIES: hypothetical protein [Chromobacterium]MCP1290917.1 hypothetical protein [Chromobacterium sp. S0633]NHR08393.1 hypothetical protein [Chromobacterium haemolyticum]
MDNKEIESRLNQLTGNLMGVQTLLLSVVATSGRRAEIANHFREESARMLATMNAESNLSDETLSYLDHWCTTTLSMLLSDEDL